jgi:hypothetical protein
MEVAAVSNELRCEFRDIPLSFWQSVWRFLRSGKWARSYRDLVYVSIDEPGYADAPFAVELVEVARYDWVNGEFVQKPSDPWSATVRREP